MRSKRLPSIFSLQSKKDPMHFVRDFKMASGVFNGVTQILSGDETADLLLSAVFFEKGWFPGTVWRFCKDGVRRDDRAAVASQR